MGVGSLLARSSAFSRADVNLSRRTQAGAFFSMSGLLLALVLAVSETSVFFRNEAVQKLTVDVKRGQGELPVHIDITFPFVPCAVLSLDSLDMAGAHEFGAPNAIVRTKLSATGDKLGPYETPAGEKQLLDLFGASAQLLLLSGLLQVGGAEAQEATAAALRERQGCRLSGVLPVARVAGSIHVTVHAQSMAAARSLFPDEVRHLNTTHFVTRFAFGRPFPGRVNPLDGIVRPEPAGGAGTFKYFIKLVPTFVRRRGATLSTMQYSLTEYYTRSRGAEAFTPAVSIAFDFSPLAMELTHPDGGALHFAVRLCAVVGGVASLVGALDRWTHRALNTKRASGLEGDKRSFGR